MTKKHFKAIAAVIKGRLDFIRELSDPRNDWSEGFDVGYAAALDGVAGELASLFEGENDQFNAKKFLDACGIN